MAGMILLGLGLLLVQGLCLELKNGAYEDLVVKVTGDVPVEDCKIILDNLEMALTIASQYLFSSLDGRAFIRTTTVILPTAWPDSCTPKSTVNSGSGETPDVTIIPGDSSRGRMYTQQSLGCGQPGDQIYVSFESLVHKDSTVGRSLVKEFAMYRYGVFEEQGYHNDPIYPLCYHSDKTSTPKVTGCSDLPITPTICTAPTTPYNTTEMVDSNARTSIMFAPEAPQISMFCDDGNHDRFAPTKHNSMCQRRSVLDVIINHSDFSHNPNPEQAAHNLMTDTTPKVTYVKQMLTRYVFVVENTKDMMQRESWSYLRLALRYWALSMVPINSEIGMVLAEETSKLASSLMVKNGDDSSVVKFYSSVPYTPGDYIQGGCLACAISDAADMLNNRSGIEAANNVIVVIAPGMNPSKQMDKVVDKVKKAKIKIATINYPTIMRTELLNSLAEKTSGVGYTVFEQKLNVDSSLLTTYFELRNVLYNVIERFDSGRVNLPLEIHRREIKEDGRSSITGSFILDPFMGSPTSFTFFTHNSITPLIKSLKLISPTHQIYSDRNDRFIDFKMIGLSDANLTETGTWTYTVEPYLGNPQPHFLQVMATPQSTSVVKARFWTHRSAPGGALILLVEVKRGEMPVMGAKVEVTVTKPGINGSYPHENRFELLDSGAGDPDVTKGDGVYTRYFSALETGPGLYNFEVVVDDNGNTAYSWSGVNKFDDERPCCGSSISSPGVAPISPFQRYLPKITMMITPEDITSASKTPTGRIGDLKAQIIPEDMKARLHWTAPDMGGHPVSRYEIKFSPSLSSISENFETQATPWETAQPPFPLSPGSETTFTVDMVQNRELLDKPLYFAIKAFPKSTSDFSGPISNVVRVLVPMPPPPPTVPPTYSPDNFWPNSNQVGVDPVSPSVAKAMGVGLELILPITIGFILLVVLLILYCYFCVLKRREHRGEHHKKSDKLSSTITIVPSTPQNVQSQTNYAHEVDQHHVGVPLQYDYEEETKKRYSLVNQQEQQLIEELKQQQQMAHHNGYPALSVISGGGTLNRNHPLSPFNSWSASQLLHEHERRHSPLDDAILVDHMGQPVDAYQVQHHVPPPVPPLPAFTPNGYPINYNIYEVHQGGVPNQVYQRTEAPPTYNPSLQGSMSSVNSGDKKRRNVTMV